MILPSENKIMNGVRALESSLPGRSIPCLHELVETVLSAVLETKQCVAVSGFHHIQCSRDVHEDRIHTARLGDGSFVSWATGKMDIASVGGDCGFPTCATCLPLRAA